ncbi:hypothetical protein HY061_03190 [Candidatus Azambacteria bacterium]|nr:hypothetical protein [Candidatus Azambacteria bacterium]
MTKKSLKNPMSGIIKKTRSKILKTHPGSGNSPLFCGFKKLRDEPETFEVYVPNDHGGRGHYQRIPDGEELTEVLRGETIFRLKKPFCYSSSDIDRMVKENQD